MRMRTTGKTFVLVMAVSGIAALSAAQTAQKPAFEVVSIKPSGPGSSPGGGGADGDRFVMQNTTLKVLLQIALA